MNASNLVYENVKDRVLTGTYEPGTRLPSERNLAAQFEMSRVTIGKAITRLRAEGMLCRRPGRKGNFIADANGDASSVAGKLVRFVVPGPRDLKHEHRDKISHGVLEGIHDRLSSTGADVAVSFVEDFTENACRQLISSGQEKGLGFVVWYNPHHQTDQFLSMAREADVPLVVVDAYPAGQEVDFVGSDNIAGGHQVVDHLVEMGHRKLCYVRRELDRSSLRDRHTGFLRGAVDNDLDLSTIGTFEVKGEFESGVEPVVEALLEGDWTAVAVAQDALAVELQLALLKRGVRIPQDLSIASYDDIDQAKLLPAPLTTVKQDFYEMGKMATDILLDRQAGLAPRRVQRMHLSTDLVVRQSVKRIKPERANGAVEQNAAAVV
jgi:DNA-binding LacI/PurR family transcriptional regulator/biotin operon repressor